MPIPKPRDDETEREFMDRCMGDDVMVQDYPDSSVRAAVCYHSWNSKSEGNMDIERKSFTGIELKADKPGAFMAKFAELGVVDLDGDETKPGAFEQGKSILVSAYQHASWAGEPPVGSASIREEGNAAIAEGEFNLKYDRAAALYEVVKYNAEKGIRQEWSYGFRPIDFSFEERDGKQIRILKKVEIYEISPVVKGAGINTQTLAIKNDKTGMTFADHSEAVLAAVKGLVERVKSLADLRSKEGRSISEAGLKQVAAIRAALDEAACELQKLATPEPEEKANADGQELFLQYLKVKNKIRGDLQ